VKRYTPFGIVNCHYSSSFGLLLLIKFDVI